MYKIYRCKHVLTRARTIYHTERLIVEISIKCCMDAYHSLSHKFCHVYLPVRSPPMTEIKRVEPSSASWKAACTAADRPLAGSIPSRTCSAVISGGALAGNTRYRLWSREEGEEEEEEKHLVRRHILLQSIITELFVHYSVINQISTHSEVF